MLFNGLSRSLLTIVAVALTASRAQAQAIPKPAQAQQMLQNDPTLIARLQQMMQNSGLTPDQIRARLRAQGYPEALLDQYLPGTVRSDSASTPGDEVFAAMRALGIADSASVDSLSMMARSRRQRTALTDSAFLDTLRRAMMNDSTRAAIHALINSPALQRLQADSGFQVFGQDLFQNQTTLFDANSAGAVDPNYRFGPGDKLLLFLTGD